MNSLDPYSHIVPTDSSFNMANNTTTTLSPPPGYLFATLRVGTLNCRGLNKTTASSTPQHFIFATYEHFHFQFQAKYSIWSQHCAFTRFLSSILTDYASVFSSFPSRYIILGDFNYTYSNLQYLGDHFVNGITTPGANPSVTSQRGSSQSCIDFIFLPSYMVSSIQY
ncbi:hypothetical protein V8B55DRAFT_1561380 [Mucor lusitanicus]